MKDLDGIETQPLSVAGLTIERARELISTKLKIFLHWLTMCQRKFDEPDKTMEQSANDIQENAERNTDLQQVLSYELALHGNKFCHMNWHLFHSLWPWYMDGTLRKPNKSLLLKELEIESEFWNSLPKSNVHQSAYIIDLLVMIQIIHEGKMQTFGDYADLLAQKS